MAKGLGWPAGIFPLGTPRTRTSEGSIYDAQSMTALLLFPREQRTSIWKHCPQQSHAPLAVVLADDTLRKWFGASLAVRARPSRSPKAAPTVAVSQPAESPTLANSKTHSHGHPRWYSIGYKRSLRFFSKSTPTEHLPHQFAFFL